MSESVVDLNGCKLRVQRNGRGDPLLFLHGAQGLAGWDCGLEALARSFDVIAPDHPGFGRSATADIVDDVTDLALFYLDLIKTLKIGSVHVVGQCIGGWVGLEMATRSTSGIRSLTLVNSAGLRLKGVPRADMFICSQEELMQLLFAAPAVAERWLAQWQATPEMMDQFERNSGAAAKLCWQPRLASLKLANWLHRIDVPTHVVWGDQARVIPAAYAGALRDGIAGATSAMLPACGHVAHFEQPEALAREVGAVVRRAAK